MLVCRTMASAVGRPCVSQTARSRWAASAARTAAFCAATACFAAAFCAAVCWAAFSPEPAAGAVECVGGAVGAASAVPAGTVTATARAHASPASSRDIARPLLDSILMWCLPCVAPPGAS